MKIELKKYGLICIGAFISMFFISCGDFFDESSQDEIKPSNIEELAAVMYKEAYPYYFSSDDYLNLLTDEMQCNGLTNDSYSSWYSNGSAMFQYDETMFDGVVTFPAEANSWKNYYKKIKGCNVVKDYLDKVTGTEDEKKALLGQVLFLRSYYYLKLVTIYCQPYTREGVDPNKLMGVPLILSMEVTDNKPSRNTLSEVYAQIERDLLESVDLLKKNYTAESEFRVGHVAAYILLSRLYLYMGRDEDMVKTVKYATLAMEEGPQLSSLTAFRNSTGTFNSNYSIFSVDVSSEVVWTFGSKTYNNDVYWYSEKVINPDRPPFTISSTLESLYDTANDLRYKLYIRGLVYGNNPVTFCFKVGRSASGYGDHGLRMAEVYLNRAEALIRQYKVTGDVTKARQALSDLNDLRETRYEVDGFIRENMENPDELLQFCLNERQRELCCEDGFRWFDIKRLGLSVTHRYFDSEGVFTDYTLKSNDLLYALPIPYDAISRNQNLQQNPR